MGRLVALPATPQHESGRTQTVGFHESFGEPGFIYRGQPTVGGWLHTEGNQILDSEGNRFSRRGVNIGDTREAGACCGSDPATAGTVTTIKARVDTLADEWHATFLRLVLDIHDGECPAQSGDMVRNQAYSGHLTPVMFYWVSGSATYDCSNPDGDWICRYVID